MYMYKYYFITSSSFIDDQTFRSLNSHMRRKPTSNAPGVEVESHFPGVLKNDRLEEMAVSLEFDLLRFTPGSGIHQAGTIETFTGTLKSQ